MAKSENQTLQVAVIIFAFVTIALSVATFYFFNEATANLENRLVADEEVKKADASLLTMLEENRNLRENIIGVDREMKYSEVLNAKVEVLRKLSAAMPDKDEPTFLPALEALLSTLADTKGEVKATLKKNGELVAQNIDDKNANDKRFRDRDTAFNEKQKDSSDRILEYTRLDADHITKNKELTGKVQAGLGDIAAVQADKEKALALLKNEVAVLERQVNEIISRRYEKENWNFDRPDGRIVSVNARKNTVWINIGRADELRLHIKFTVFKRGHDNVYKRQPKGAIEVTRFLGPTMAEARITSSEDADPILDGDVIFTPTWSPGEPERFVLAGDFDVNGDKKPDNEMIHTLIRMSGGIIEDELTISIRYLLLGTPPQDATAAGEFDTLRNKAEKLGIRIMTLREFIEYSGTRDLIRQATSLDAIARDQDDVKDVLRNREAFKKDRFKQRVPPDGARRLEAGAQIKGSSKESTTRPSKRKGSAY